MRFLKATPDKLIIWLAIQFSNIIYHLPNGFRLWKNSNVPRHISSRTPINDNLLNLLP